MTRPDLDPQRPLAATDSGPGNRALWATLALVTTLAFVISPLLTPGFGGFDPDLYPVPQVDPPVQPAGWAFSIWGVIYLWLLISAVFGWLRRRDDPAWTAARIPLSLSLGVGSVWLAVALQSPVWATVLIWLMLIAAMAALRRTPLRDRVWLRGPLALYAGWLTAASLVSLGLLGAGYGVAASVLGRTGWAALVIVTAILLGGAVQSRLPRAPFYGVGIAWALIGIAAQNAGNNLALTALAALGAILLAWLALRSARAKQA